MADTAAFFAKKKKKKAFKFNANKVDVSKISSNTHVDAPAVSSEEVSKLKSNNNGNNVIGSNNSGAEIESHSDIGGNTSGDQWDDNALAAKLHRPMTTTSGGGPSELLDMKALEKKRNEQDDIAERMRVEETKAALAAAREGMEKEAQRLKEERESKIKDNFDANTNEHMKGLSIGSNDSLSSKPRFGAAASKIQNDSSSSTNHKWVPPHMRNAPSAARDDAPYLQPSRNASSSSSSRFQKQVDTQDENLFPDLATADKIIAREEEQHKHETAYLLSKQTKKQQVQLPKKDKDVTTPLPTGQENATISTETETEKYTVLPTSIPTPLPSSPKKEHTTVSVGAGLKKKKKKKKDISTFKTS
eukprot:CAMPEP_0184858754 /NCGR_PEP_ID=MMETSP0580-20130426/3817_1 /TAXON_ID=1118495 /ORGANISM="Dactyliosolen fragilissimus" /LENGTH=359 /DNA_ID=CAMNT_0027355057 /DNA_START=35 /DNA_END=1114 /DNA_ORIENTATION=-